MELNEHSPVANLRLSYRLWTKCQKRIHEHVDARVDDVTTDAWALVSIRVTDRLLPAIRGFWHGRVNA